MNLGRQVYYVEGITVICVGNRDLPIEHGWLEVDGEVVDVTLYADNLDASRYYSIFRLDYEGVMGSLEKSCILPLYSSGDESRREFLLKYHTVLEDLSLEEEDHVEQLDVAIAAQS